MHAARLTSLVEYTSFAARTLGEIARSTQLPFLLTASTLSAEILAFVRAAKTVKEETFQIVRQIHEILCVILRLYSATGVAGNLPPGILYDIRKFTHCLQKIYTYMKAQREMGKFKQLLKQADNASRLQACHADLQEIINTLTIQLGTSMVSAVGQAQKDIEQQHEELLALLAAHPDINSSDSSSVGTLSIFTSRRVILDILSKKSARVVILGPGGMGKTSLALAVLHSDDIASKYVHRFFVSCQSSPSYSELLSNIASHIGIDQGPNLDRKIAQHFAGQSASLLVLDNFETPWETLEDRKDIEEFLSLLADVPHLAMLLTMRGAERPGKVNWTRPCPSPLASLSGEAALQTFMDIVDGDEDDGKIQDLLDLTDNLPLAVSLIANIAAYEGCDATLTRWRTESTRLLSDGYDKTSSLETSITMSLSSPRMDVEAQKLLSILSMLPDGLSDADLVQSDLPISNILHCKATLIRTSLAYTDHGRRLKVLVPIREYVYSIHPPSSEVKLAAREYFRTILQLWDGSQHNSSPNSIPQIPANLGNLRRLLSDAMQMDYPDTLASLRSVLLFNSFCRHAGSAVAIPVSHKIVHWQNDPVFGAYILENIHSAVHAGDEAADLIQSGHSFFEASGDLERARWHHTLGSCYFARGDIAKSKQYCESALSLASTSNGPTHAQFWALLGLAKIMRLAGDYEGGISYTKRASQCANSLGDIYIESQALSTQADHCSCMGDFREAARLCAEARALVKACGLEGSMADLDAQLLQAEIHMQKTEYSDARAAETSLLTADPQYKWRDAFARLNLALIDVATDAASDTIRANVSMAKAHFSTLNFALGGHLCDVADGDLLLRDGNPADARLLFTVTFQAFNGKWDEAASICLERLADHGNGMHSVQETLHWATVYLASAKRAKSRLAMMKAIRSLGDVLAALDDEETSLQLFEVALKGFTSMGVHAWAAGSMVRISGVLERRETQNGRAIDLLREARPLFERSSQLKQIAFVNAKLGGLIH
ncbi:hypothetical protein B0H16DRAFT_1884352 [Mycena metata]|uniref:ORC1/DEAH AAA+ ATPase domain-containing protein n=1 Tax=Mycena metata TaxID=1033252 RepID=A0AAD7NHW1_9AGAR|nr:hypothetical protein B0H16DRAFT_1884352 [Mycena metata]